MPETMSQTLTRITADELKKALASDQPPVIINVLGREAYEAQHIPGSINIPADDIERVERLVPFKDEKIVVYCANEDCDASPQAAQQLEDMGYTNVADFEAGYAGWRRAGFSLVGEEA